MRRAALVVTMIGHLRGAEWRGVSSSVQQCPAVSRCMYQCIDCYSGIYIAMNTALLLEI